MDKANLKQQETVKEKKVTVKEKKVANPGEMHISNYASYRRPKSVFHNVIEENEKVQKNMNLYTIRQKGKVSVEKEGRWEFRTTADCPPPPPFIGGKKRICYNAILIY